MSIIRMVLKLFHIRECTSSVNCLKNWRVRRYIEMKSIEIHISDIKLNESTVILEVEDNASDAEIEKAASLKVADLINWYWDMGK